MALQLRLNTPGEPILAEGSVPLRLTIRNGGPEPAEAPTGKGPPPFEYSVLSHDGARRIQSASLRLKEATMAPGAPHWDPPVRALAPDDAIFYRDDLAALLVNALRPGSYQLEAACRGPGNAVVRSNRAPLDVVVSRPKSILQTMDAKRSALILVEFHQHESGRLALRKRETAAGTFLGPFHAVHDFTPQSNIHDSAIAVAADERPPAHWRWVAWLDGRDLCSGVARAVDMTYLKGPLDVGLESPSLIQSGYGFDDRRGMFLVTGLEKGRRRIQLWTMPAGGTEAPRSQEVQLTSVPNEVPSATLVRRENSAGEIVLSWMLHGGRTSRFVQARIDLSGAVTAPPEDVFTTTRPLAAVQCAPLWTPGSGDAHQLLLVPGEPEEAFTVVRIDAGNRSKVTQQDLPPVSALGGRHVDRWVLPSHPSSTVPALAVSGRQLWFPEGATAWREFEAGDVPPASVGLWSFPGGQVWCTWFDRAAAYGYRRLDGARV
jgi:hypothetical protein